MRCFNRDKQGGCQCNDGTLAGGTGEMRCIGATTTVEYRTHIEKDKVCMSLLLLLCLFLLLLLLFSFFFDVLFFILGGGGIVMQI